MTLGPPPSAAGPSGNAPPVQTPEGVDNANASVSNATTAANPAPGPSVSTGPYTSQFSVQPQPAARPYYGHQGGNAYQTGYATNTARPGASQHGTQHSPAGGHYSTYASQHPQAQGSPQAAGGSYPYYNYHPNAWANAWNTGSYQYGAGGSYPYSYAHATPQSAPQQYAPSPSQQSAPPAAIKRNTPTPPPPPPPPRSPPPAYHKDWDVAIKSFLSAIGFSQAVKGFEADMVVLNPEFERKVVPGALQDLVKHLSKLGQDAPESVEATVAERPLEERKLDYVHLADGVKPRSQTSITKDISRFLARNRARNDASNRNEFLLSLAEKRRRLNENGDSVSSEPIPSCARTDAKTQNRDLQMKYDIAKNEDGPLRRTLKSGASEDAGEASTSSKPSQTHVGERIPTAERYPALDERLQNVEKHLAIRYVPSPPRSLLDRLKYLEDHLIHLEREYPPWAALHFNQPNRGWPPPPRPTPLIVPSHLTSTSASEPAPSAQADASPGSSATPTAQGFGQDTSDTASKGKGKPGRNTKSSLHRAVMERLEVQKAINDLTGGDGG
ncbi:hypothetical protein C8Q77DRAFT_1157448 [Trametes polyzona]|nr:hypothetical protein C8Q77DRAFT_1157448 [Trametes polyzona]